MMKFGAIHTPDSRDAGYAARDHVPAVTAYGLDDLFDLSREWYLPKLLDQGFSQECCAYSAAHTILAEPFARPSINVEGLYSAMCKIDGLQHDPATDSGSTPRAAMEILKQWGFIQSYLWFSTAEEAWNFIAADEGGPLLFTMPWTGDMEIPKDDGTIPVPARLDASTILGFHCICANGINGDRRAFHVPNSRGPTWGKEGRGWLGFDDLSRILEVRGSVIVAPYKHPVSAK